MKVYVVIYCENENGGRATDDVIGVFDELQAARKCLEKLFHKVCDSYGVEELNMYSYVNQDDFNIEDEYQSFEAFGRIVEQDLQSEFFPVISLTRDDLEMEGFKAADLDDDTMQVIASRAADYMLDGDYWTCIYEAAMFNQIPRKED